jgi:transcriptional regulator GlxA family with amidase domain
MKKNPAANDADVEPERPVGAVGEHDAGPGMSPASWRVKARLLTAIPRLRDESVTAVAASLGYASPAAFSYAFSRAFAAAPSALRC